MADLEQVWIKVRSQTKSLSDPIQKLTSYKDQLDGNFAKLINHLNKTYIRLVDLVETVPANSLYISRDTNFIPNFRHSIRAPLSILISVAVIMDQLHSAQLSEEQREEAHSIERIATDLVNYLEALNE